MADQTPRPTVLIVDDDDATLSGMQQLLEAAGYRTLAASTFNDGLRILRTGAPDLLLADVRLGLFNGLQFVATNPQATPTIMVTGFPDPVIEAEARRFGAEYVVKPIVPADLLSLIERKLKERPVAQQGFNSVRRWERKQLSQDLKARIEDSPARILDVSYGGLRFEIERGADLDMPGSFDVSLPQSALSIHASLVWSNRTGERNWLCGAIVSDADQHVVSGWRGFVDAMA